MKLTADEWQTVVDSLRISIQKENTMLTAVLELPPSQVRENSIAYHKAERLRFEQLLGKVRSEAAENHLEDYL